MSVTNTVATATFSPCTIPLPYTIYSLLERATGRHYVGLTTRTLPKRVSAHLSQARRNRQVRAGGLMTALRHMLDASGRFEDVWDAQVVGQAATTNEARAMERHWIMTLAAASPSGFNLMPGGSSVGGPYNVVPLTVILPDGSRRNYACIQDAVADRNKGCLEAGAAALLPSTIYARLSSGWSPAEALGHAPHEDGRGARPSIMVEGQTFGNLRTVSAATELAIATLRSRLHRRRLSRSGADLGTDMRRTGADHIPKRSTPLGLRLPGTSTRLTVREYAERTNTPASTILHRWHAAFRAGLDPATMSPAALLAHMVTAEDRRRLITLHLPDGRCITGGERELVRQVLGDPELAASRAVLLSASGIRRRLRLLPECDRHDPSKVAVAFGFNPLSGGN